MARSKTERLYWCMADIRLKDCPSLLRVPGRQQALTLLRPGLWRSIAVRHPWDAIVAEDTWKQHFLRRGTLVRLAGASGLVGLVMHWTGWTPLRLIESLVTNFSETVAAAIEFVVWLLGIGLMGAVVVVPAWIVLHVFRRARK